MVVNLVVYAVWTVVNIYLYTDIHEDSSTVKIKQSLRDGKLKVLITSQMLYNILYEGTQHMLTML